MRTLCREWHCPPSVARHESARDALALLTVLGVEAEAAEAEARKWRTTH